VRADRSERDEWEDTSHSPFRFLDKGARAGGSRIVSLWVYDASMLEGAEAVAFFSDVTAG
jgi:hypothetical protein